MDIEQAKSVPLALILEKLGYTSIRSNHHETLYASPFSQREADHLTIFPLKNIWTDSALNKRGDPVAFMIIYLQYKEQPHTVEDALQKIAEITGVIPSILFIPFEKPLQEEHGKVKKDANSIEHRGLINFLNKKVIPYKIASRYLKQIKVYPQGKKKSFLALGLRNEDKGWEIFNPYYRGFKGTRDVFFVRGYNPDNKELYIFKDIFDFLSATIRLGKDGRLEKDALIIHSYSLMPNAINYISKHNYTSVYTWMPNDDLGALATKSFGDFLKAELSLTAIPMNPNYAQYLDMSAFHRAKYGEIK